MLQTYWKARGAWEDSWVAFSDNCIINADASNYVSVHLSQETISRNAAVEKEKNYPGVAEELCDSITDGVLHHEDVVN